MKTAILTVNELATEIVGDGKNPNKYFITIGYGWYQPQPYNNGEDEDSEMVQAGNSLESVSILVESKESAINIFNSIELNRNIKQVTGHTIGSVTIEDRRNGVIKEKRLTQDKRGNFYIDTL